MFSQAVIAVARETYGSSPARCWADVHSTYSYETFMHSTMAHQRHDTCVLEHLHHGIMLGISVQALSVPQKPSHHCTIQALQPQTCRPGTR